jgi:Flp pilus assembly pilin Flp
MKRTLLTWLREEHGQALLEYAVLTALAAVIVGAALSDWPARFLDAFGRWNAGVERLWEPPEPGR